MIYLTYNDPPSGVFSSQVNDVCNFLNKNLNAKIRLVAIISLRGFSANRKKIRKEVPDAIVLPALPKANYWKFSYSVFSLVCIFTGARTVIARNVIATKLALFARRLGIVKKVCMDGRGAIAAEWREYDVVADEKMRKSISSWESKAVLESDFRIAVSEKLAAWWKSEYGYTANRHVIIPCTLHTNFRMHSTALNEEIPLRNSAGFQAGDIILVYSGSASGWQSFSAIEIILEKLLRENKNIKLVFLSQKDEAIDNMIRNFPGQVSRQWLDHQKVADFLMLCDYGILYREDTITNRVAAPTKFAEYLSAGLPVIISEHIGDYTGFVETHQCGIVIRNSVQPVVEKTTPARRSEMIRLATEYYSKQALQPAYQELLKNLN